MEDGRTGERGRPVGRAPASALLLRPRSSEPSQPKRAGRVSRRTLIWPFGSADLGRSRCTPAPAASTSSSSEILAFLTAVIGDNIGFAVGHSGGRLVERFGRYIPGTVLFTLRAALSETPCLLGATGRASTQRGLHQGKAKVRKDAERSAANQNGCERFDAQLADCRIDRRGATMVTRTTPPLLVRSEHAAAGRHVAVVVVYRTPGPGGAAHPADAGGFIVDRQSPGSIPVLLVTGCDNAFGMNALGFPS